uniref:Uncharacterized protein n=1 Tax=Arundo donax TaxID=35708 RepID=A0A0A9DXG3_ARUDO
MDICKHIKEVLTLAKFQIIFIVKRTILWFRLSVPDSMLLLV